MANMHDGSPQDKRSVANETEGTEEGLEARRSRLEAELAERQEAETTSSEDAATAASGYGQAIKLSSEFIAGVFVGAVLGYFLDQYFGTSPWGMIIFLLLGFAAGVLNVMRSVGVVAKPEPGNRSGKQD